MMVKNEAHHLRQCLDSIMPLRPEMIVVDTGSTDETRHIAADYGAEVLPFPFDFVDFSAARNAGLNRATERWILVLDADETMDADSLPIISQIATGDENAGYFLERRADETAIDYVVRLFPNRPAYRYQGRVHETVDRAILAGGGRLLESQIRIHHNFAPDAEARRRKNFWYIQILKEELAANPLDDTRLDFLAAEYHQLEMFDEAIAITEQITRLRPHDARAFLFLGTYHLLFKPDFQKARADFNQALKLRPGYPEAESFLRLLDSKEAGPSC
jgi:glycosyltransferase involved in cell wall biosynthesis